MKRVRRFFDRLFGITPSQPEDTSGAIRILQLESINAQLLEAVNLTLSSTFAELPPRIVEALQSAIYAATEE